jgi:hypothetical protein
MAKVKIEKTEIATPKKEKKHQFEIIRHGQPCLKAHTNAQARQALLELERSEETLINIMYDFKCYPLDGYVAINGAMEEVFGFTRKLGTPGFFGDSPPVEISIKTGVNSEVQVSAGRIAPPSWEGGYIDMRVEPDSPMSLMVMGQVKKKFKPSINKVVDLAKDLVRTKSIYRGQAVEQDFSYIDLMLLGKPFKPNQCAPRFIDVTKPIKLILPHHIQTELDTDILAVIKNPGDFRYNEMRIKHGALFSGIYGTGKTLATMLIAQVATQAGWSYFQLKTPDKFLYAYDMAQFYAPAVLVLEDCDAIFGGARNDMMNQILETLDGVAAKGQEVFTIFTSNNAGAIHDSFMRSHRIDNHLEFGKLDEEAAGRFVVVYAEGYLAPDVDVKEVGYAFEGMVPADVTEGIDKAKRIAIAKLGREIKGRVTTEMLMDAAEVLRRKLGMGRTVIPQAEFNLRIVQAAWHIQQGREIPIDLEVNPESYFSRGDRMKRAKEAGSSTEKAIVRKED